MAHFLYMTRHGYYREGYQAEWEPDTDDTDSFMGYTDSESEIGEEVLPRTVHECNIMEVEGKDIGADDIAARKPMTRRSPAQHGMSETLWTVTAMRMEILKLDLSSHLGPWSCSTNLPPGTPSTHVTFRSK